MKKLFPLFIGICLMANAFAQSGETFIFPSINAGYVAGGPVFHKTAVFRNGLNIDASLTGLLENDIIIGGGVGLVLLEEEIFIPIFAQGKYLFAGDAPSWYVGFKLGYAFGHNTKFNSLPDYKYRGGVYIEPRVGYQFDIGENYMFNTGFKIIGQFASLSYNSPATNNNYSEKLRYVLLGFYCGVDF